MKKCEYCNTENNDQATHCEKCGIALTAQQPVEEIQEEPKTEEAPPKKKKFLPILLGIVAAILLTVVILICLLEMVPNPKSIGETSLLPLYDSRSKKTVLICDTQLTGNTIDGIVETVKTSFDGKTLAIRTKDQLLYIATPNDITLVAEDVEVFELASSGDGLAYKTTENVLFLYDTKTKERNRIAKDLLKYQCALISPDGKSLTYEKRTETYDSMLYVYCNGTSTAIGKNLYPIGISNAAEYVYYYKIGPSLYSLYMVNRQGEHTLLAENCEEKFILNCDQTQMLFIIGNVCYISNHGNVTKVYTYMDMGEEDLFAPNLQVDLHKRKFQLSNSSDAKIYLYNTESLAKCFYYVYYDWTEETFFYLNEDWMAKTFFHEEPREFAINKHNKTMCILTNEDVLLKIDVIENDISQTQIAEEVNSFVVTSDGSIYYRTYDRELWYQSGNNPATKIAEDVFAPSITEDDCVLFSKEDNDEKKGSSLYVSKNGSKPTIVAKNVFSVFTQGGVTYYCKNFDEEKNTCDLYAAVKDAKFYLVLKRINRASIEKFEEE